MIIAVGTTTGKVYMEGKNKKECLRKLHAKYPSKLQVHHNTYSKHGKSVENVYPEKLQLLRR